MGGQKFQYDESGGTFFYFVLSFLALVLIPSTYYWWPRKQKEDPESEEQGCHCVRCQKKKLILLSSDPWKGTKNLLTKVVIVLGWLILIFLAYKVSQFDYEYANFDPYEILGIAPSSSQSQIKKAYRKLSLVLHPDKETGDEKAFMKLTKAYQALTDDEARRNWEKYGNPDGPGAMSFGIALPSWIVEKENSFWVLGLYGLVFMVALPTVVGMWWYRSIRYSGDQVLLDTTQIYFFFFHKTPSMALKRVIMILGASLEFEKKYNSEVVERPTDNIEVPQLIKQLYNLGEKNKERPLCYYYSIKARALIHAHLSRIPLNSLTLDKDRMYIVKKCPYLIQEMVSCVSQLIILAYARRVPRLPSIETIENCMKLCPMVVQGLWEYKSPLLQLPHISEEHLKHFSSKKRQVKTLQQLAQLKADEKRTVLRFLSDEEYLDVIKVLGKMPLIDFSVRSEVIDDEASNVYTAGAIITVTCTLERKQMKSLFGVDSAVDKHLANEEAAEQTDKEVTTPQETKEQPKRPVWQKKNKKGTKKGSKKTSGKKQQQQQQQAKESKTNQNASNSVKKEPTNEIKKPVEKKLRNHNENDDSDDDERESSGRDSDVTDDEAEKSDNEERIDKGSGGSEGEEDDDDWSKFQAGIGKRTKALEGKSKQSHTVHCPFFPDVKQEYWWVYISDRKSRTLLTAPCLVTALVTVEEVQLKFTAPRWPGLYTFTVCLRSDSYLGFDQSQDIKLDVKEAAQVPLEHPQWDISGEEDGGNKDGAPSDSVSEFTTDEDVDDSDCNS